MVVLLLFGSRVTGQDAAGLQPAHRLVGERFVDEDVDALSLHRRD
jgi:hypothetical protein